MDEQTRNGHILQSRYSLLLYHSLTTILNNPLLFPYKEIDDNNRHGYMYTSCRRKLRILNEGTASFFIISAS